MEIRMTKSINLASAEAAMRQARRERRSMSNLITFAVERYLLHLGVWKDNGLEGTASAPNTEQSPFAAEAQGPEA
jgi:hypothetical protein